MKGPAKNDDKHGKKTRDPLVIQRLKSCLEKGEPRTVRYSIVPCDLKKATESFHGKRVVRHTLSQQAEDQALYRKCTGMLANSLLLQKLSAGEDLPKINKTLYDQCWSAWDKRRRPSQVNKKTAKNHEKTTSNPAVPYLDTLLEITNFDVTTLPNPVLFELRSTTTRDMETVAVNHVVENFPRRVNNYILWRLANLPVAHNLSNKVLRRVGKVVSKFALKGSSELSTQLVSEDTLPGVTSVLQEVADVVRPLIPLNPRLSVKKSFRDNANRLLPFLASVSREFERVQVERRAFMQSNNDVLRSMTPVERRTVLRTEWLQRGFRLCGKPFSLLPDWQVKPVFVDYADTQLKTLFGSKMGSLEFFEKHVFDLPRRLRRPNWYFGGFRTNGVELHVRLVALASRQPSSPNSLELKHAGYQIPVPENPVHPLKVPRGIYRITQTRYDTPCLPVEELRQVEAILVDPGLNKPVAVRQLKLSDADDAVNIDEKSTTWSVTAKEYYQQTKVDSFTRREKQRRSSRSLYRSTLDSLRHTTKKTAQLESFHAYAGVVLRDIKVLRRELCSRYRRVSRYLQQKNKNRFLDKLADRLTKPREENVTPVVFFGDGTFRSRLGTRAVPRKEIVQRCSHRAITFVLSEYNSSKCCPVTGCDGKMKDVPETHRIRHCTSVSTAESPCAFTTKRIDRDDCATISLARCAYDALRYNQRPSQFCRE